MPGTYTQILVNIVFATKLLLRSLRAHEIDFDECHVFD
jgi:hypothetical protein